MTRVSHGIDRFDVTFDDPKLVANAGLLLVATLSGRLGLEALIDATVRLVGRVGGARPGRKVLTLEFIRGTKVTDLEGLRARRISPVKVNRLLVRTYLKQLLEDHVDELGRIITQENGKTFAEGKAELRRAIENVEVACGIPILMQGYNLEDVARGIDELMIRQPLGVVTAITPFNFPIMIPFWFLPYAIACGNTFILNVANLRGAPKEIEIKAPLQLEEGKA